MIVYVIKEWDTGVIYGVFSSWPVAQEERDKLAYQRGIPWYDLGVMPYTVDRMV